MDMIANKIPDMKAFAAQVGTKKSAHELKTLLETINKDGTIDRQIYSKMTLMIGQRALDLSKTAMTAGEITALKLLAEDLLPFKPVENVQLSSNGTSKYPTFEDYGFKPKGFGTFESVLQEHVRAGYTGFNSG